MGKLPEENRTVVGEKKGQIIRRIEGYKIGNKTE
jgi:hypothetical protein